MNLGIGVITTRTDVGWDERSESQRKVIHENVYPDKDCRWYILLYHQSDQRGTNSLLIDRIADLREAFRYTRQAHPFILDALVVLPEHLHCLWTLPEEDDDYPTRWHLIKSRFTRSIGYGECISPSRRRKGERGIRQRRYWEHLIRNDCDYRTHADYIHYNPVKHGLVGRASDWPYSTFHRWQECGMYPPDWGADHDVAELDRG